MSSARQPPGSTEIVFVEGHSSDDTFLAIQRAIAENPQRKCKLLRQEGVGKGDAVRAGFNASSGPDFSVGGPVSPASRLMAARMLALVASWSSN